MKPSFKYFKKYLPKSLLGRILLILIVPTVLAQGVSIYIFYQRHMQHVSRQLALSLSAEVASITEYVKLEKDANAQDQYLSHAKLLFGFSPKLMTTSQINAHVKGLEPLHYKEYTQQLTSRIPNKFEVYSDNDKVISTIIYIGDEIMVIDAPYKRLINSTSIIFILWMTGITSILLVVSVMFLKNQIRPVVRLARLADGFGRGNDLTYVYKPEGAKEIQQAFTAFITMHERLSRFIKQRTEMLAGISHDLRTPLTRMKLELAMLKDKPEFVQGFANDISELERMINIYIDFAQGNDGEEAKLCNLADLLADVTAKYKNFDISLQAEKITTYLKPNAIARAFQNLIDNAVKFASKLEIKAYKDADFITIEFADNGAGIAVDKREEVFKPFYRIEESRNLETGGAGLGLSIVRDIINAHGGTISLSDSALGGLNAVVCLPA